MELGRDSEEQVPVERVVVGLEWVRHPPGGHRNEDRCLHLDKAPTVHESPYGADHAAPENGDPTGLRVRYEVEVSLPVPGLGVG